MKLALKEVITPAAVGLAFLAGCDSSPNAQRPKPPAQPAADGIDCGRPRTVDWLKGKGHLTKRDCTQAGVAVWEQRLFDGNRPAGYTLSYSDIDGREPAHTIKNGAQTDYGNLGGVGEAQRGKFSQNVGEWTVYGQIYENPAQTKVKQKKRARAADVPHMTDWGEPEKGATVYTFRRREPVHEALPDAVAAA